VVLRRLSLWEALQVGLAAGSAIHCSVSGQRAFFKNQRVAWDGREMGWGLNCTYYAHLDGQIC